MAFFFALATFGGVWHWRAKYWCDGSQDKSDYVDIPGGVSFENFEMREKYYPGQQFYFGITRKSPQEVEVNLPEL